MPSETIALASDHGGVTLKDLLRAYIEGQGMQVVDLGSHGDGAVDYPDYARALAETLKDGKAERGILVCGTGIGMAISANRWSHIRAALVHDAYGARMARQHNDANVLVLGGRNTGPEVAKECVDVFLSAGFDGGRHARRVAKLGEQGER